MNEERWKQWLVAQMMHTKGSATGGLTYEDGLRTGAYIAYGHVLINMNEDDDE